MVETGTATIPIRAEETRPHPHQLPGIAGEGGKSIQRILSSSTMVASHVQECRIARVQAALFFFQFSKMYRKIACSLIKPVYTVLFCVLCAHTNLPVPSRPCPFWNQRANKRYVRYGTKRTQMLLSILWQSRCTVPAMAISNVCM